MDEFELIRRFFDRPTDAEGVLVGIGDDGAVLRPRPGRDQIQVIDTLVESVHFPGDINAADLGYRVVAVNLSDVAAMGAEPRWMTLALTLPKSDELWVADFARGLFEAAAEYDVALIGGDMTGGEKVVATVHITADVEKGKALLRSGAVVGDTVYVTGTLGDAAAGLALHQRGESDSYLIGRYLRPKARVTTGRQLLGLANAVIDVSDGLVGDLKKLLEASAVGAELEVEKVPLSDAIRARFDAADRVRLALTGGDDYELCFTARPDAIKGLAHVTAIGRVVEGAGLSCRENGVVVEYEDSGYRHFL